MKKKKDMQARTNCRGCPYPSTGFLRVGSDGECMKTRIQKIKKMPLGGESKNVLPERLDYTNDKRSSKMGISKKAR